MNILFKIKYWFGDEINQLLLTIIGLFVIAFGIMFLWIYIEEFEPLDSKCPRMATITDKQVLTDKDECLPYWVGQEYILQNNILNGKYVLSH